MKEVEAGGNEVGRTRETKSCATPLFSYLSGVVPDAGRLIVPTSLRVLPFNSRDTFYSVFVR